MEHGGDIYRNKVNMDFSVNTSPYGVPPMVWAAVQSAMDSISVYPDPLYEELRDAIGNAEGVSGEHIICGNGSSELLFAAVRSIAEITGKDKAACLLVPCFSEYEKAVKAAGFTIVKKHVLKEENGFLPEENTEQNLLEDAGLLILGNPNNPTGRLFSPAWLKNVVSMAEEKHAYVVLDETFLPFTGKEKAYDLIQSDHLLRIRAFTKTMSVPGLRLGYLICKNEDLLERIRKTLPDWNVSSVAAKAGVSCAQAMGWFTEKAKNPENGIKVLRENLQKELTILGCKVYSSETNFLLLQGPEDLYEALLERGILIRDCSNYDGLTKGFFRVAVKSREENEAFIFCLQNILSGSKQEVFTSRDGMHAMESVLQNKGSIVTAYKDVAKLLKVQPAAIEKTSFSILSGELLAKGIILSGDTEPVIKRCIHTTADFQYASTLVFSREAVAVMKKLLREGACIVTDTNMALAGISKSELSKYGCEAYCFMADPEIAKIAKERGCTRASVSMEHAAKLGKKIIFAVGNAPTALVTLCDMEDRGEFHPDFVIGVPVGFVNVEQAKEMVMERKFNYIVNRGRKGGSNVAAAIVNAVLYAMRDE